MRYVERKEMLQVVIMNNISLKHYRRHNNIQSVIGIVSYRSLYIECLKSNGPGSKSRTTTG